MFLYVIGAVEDGPVKLGFSADPDRRVNELQTGHCHALRVYHAEPVCPDKVRLFERLLHRDMRYQRARGEWYNLTVEEAIAQVRFTLIQYDAVDDLADKVRRHRI